MVPDDNKIKICRVTLKFLKYSLIWPSEVEEMKPGKRYYIQITSLMLMTSLWSFAVIMHLIMSFITDVRLHVSEDVAVVVSFTGIYYMLIMYVKNQPKIALLLRDLSNFDNFGQPSGFEEKVKTLSFWSKFFFGYAAAGISLYSFIKLLGKTDCEKINVERNLNENCGIVSPIWTPFRINYFPVFPLVFIYVFVTIQILMKVGLIVSYNALEIVHHLTLRIDHLNIMIVECFDNQNYNACRNKLTTCILYHLEILSFAARLNDCFSTMLFAHLTITGLACGCLEKQFVEEDSKVCALIHLFGWIFALFVACVGGQHLINASESIPEAVWASKWYQADPRLQKDVLFLLLRSQEGLYLSTGAFGVLSFPLFVSVVKMSYSILAMLTS